MDPDSGYSVAFNFEIMDAIFPKQFRGQSCDAHSEKKTRCAHPCGFCTTCSPCLGMLRKGQVCTTNKRRKRKANQFIRAITQRGGNANKKPQKRRKS